MGDSELMSRPGMSIRSAWDHISDSSGGDKVDKVTEAGSLDFMVGVEVVNTRLKCCYAFVFLGIPHHPCSPPIRTTIPPYDSSRYLR